MPFQPLIQEIDYRDPFDALRSLPAEAGLVLLDSAMGHPELGRWSWLAAEPFGRFTVTDGAPAWNGDALDGPAIEALRHALARHADIARDTPPPFPCGATGFFTYEAGRLFERLPEPKRARQAGPDIDLFFHDVGVAFDVVDRRAFIVSTGRPEDDPLRRVRRSVERAEALLHKLASGPARRRSAPIAIARAAWRPNMSAADFMRAVERTREYIAAGDIFQANLTQRWTAELPDGFDPFALYGALREANPAPFGAFIMTPERLVASTSPEGFLLLQDGLAETRPIKGTRPRSADRREDRRLAEELLASEKDRAENIMIVDLLRNDLSRVCLPRSVETPTLCGLESYASVHHLVSVVRGRLKPGRDALDLVAACFPGGSITGAPKIRAMEIIHALEPEPRGVYCGSVVHFGYDGSLRSSIAIRTLTVEDGLASIGAGGGITLLSSAEDEYEESLLKAERMFQALEPARLAKALP